MSRVIRERNYKQITRKTNYDDALNLWRTGRFTKIALAKHLEINPKELPKILKTASRERFEREQAIAKAKNCSD